MIDTRSGKELGRIATSRRLPSGLVISPDSRYAFVTLEGVGAEPGTVDVLDLTTLTRVASVDVGPTGRRDRLLEDGDDSARPTDEFFDTSLPLDRHRIVTYSDGASSFDPA